jgi:hypothetical protein
MTLATVLRKRGLRWIALALTALVAGALGGLTVLWVNGTADNPVVGWFGGWLKSPGFTGLCAVVAASIAFIGISLQLNANRERDADAAWWQSFEWASDRGLPRDPLELGLSFEAALDTLNALATAARTDIQKNAVRGVVDELLRSRESGVRDQAPAANDLKVQPSEQIAEESVPGALDGTEHARDGAGLDSDGSASAVLRYALQQVGTAAESRRASASAYETEVLRALSHQYDKVIPMSGATAGDVIVRARSRQLVVEIKWAPGTILNMRGRAQLNTVDVVISNVKVVNLPANVKPVVWDPRRDASTVLRQALDAIK